MVNMEPISPDEQELYDNADAIGEKCEWLQGEIEAMILRGSLTMDEAKRVASQTTDKIGMINDELMKAHEDGKAKKISKLEAQKQALGARLDAATHAQQEPTVYALKDAEGMLEVKMLLALDMIANSKQLLDVEEMKKLHAKDGLEEQLMRMEEQARGWFQEAGEFDALIGDVYKKAQRQFKAASDKKAKENEGWSTAGSGKARKGRFG